MVALKAPDRAADEGVATGRWARRVSRWWRPWRSRSPRASSRTMTTRPGHPSSAPTLAATPTPEPGASEPPVADLASFYAQELTWEPCRDGFECATLRCPSTTRTRAAETIELALLKDPADDPARAGRLAGRQPGRPGRARHVVRRELELAFRECCATTSTSSASTRAAPATPTRSTASPTPSSTPSSPPTPTRTRRRRAPSLQDHETSTRAASRTPTACRPRHHGRGRPRHGRAAGRAGRGGDALLRRVLRHQAGRDLRRLFPDKVGRMVLDGAVDLVHRRTAAQPRAGRRLRGGADGRTCRTASTRATASSATPSTRGCRPSRT